MKALDPKPVPRIIAATEHARMFAGLPWLRFRRDVRLTKRERRLR
jgi:hypothetical protein